MALPTSGQITFSQIWAEVYWTVHSTEECSMYQMASDSGNISTAPPINITEWYGYSGIRLSVVPSGMYWLGTDVGSGYGITATVTIVPDATFASTIPSWITRTYNYTSNTMWYYPNSQNTAPSYRIYTSTVSAGGYPNDTIYLEQGPGESTTHTPNAPTCLLGSTMISMSNETFKPIEKIKTGDKILSFNSNTGKNEESIVEQILPAEHSDMIIIIIDDIEITCTVDHPFMGDTSWLSYIPTITNKYYKDSNTKRLKEGMNLHTITGKKKISSITYYSESTITYQITRLSKNSTYYANTLLTRIEEL